MASKFRKHVQKFHRDFDGFLGHLLGKSPHFFSILEKKPDQLKPENFNKFTYSKLKHFQSFRLLPVYQRQTLATCDLKVYQDLFVYTFILENVPKGSKILELGGGNSRIIDCLKNEYEFWNLDKLEGQGYGPKSAMHTEGYMLVRDYIGNFSPELPERYFDFVYSISVIEHFSTDESVMKNIIDDQQRLLKNHAYCLHCADALLFQDHLWFHPIIDQLSSKIDGIKAETDFDKITSDSELWTIPKYAYYTRWFPITKKRLTAFGRPFSINLFWKTIP